MAFYDEFLENKISQTYTVSDICQGMSFRTYKRIHLKDGTSFVLMITPTDKPLEDGQCAIEGVIRPFLKVNKYLSDIGINVPVIEAVDEDAGLILLEDYGEKTFYDLYQGADVSIQNYKAAVDVLVKLAISKPLAGLVRYEEDLATIRGDFFLDDYLPALRDGMDSSKAEYAELHLILTKIYKTVCDVPWGTILWDYHSPNLMPTKGAGLKSIGILDFQDAKLGPLSYDLASLLYDARFSFPKKLRDELFDYFVEGANIKDVDKFRNSFELTGLLRNIGVLGRFARSAYRDGRTEFIGKIDILWPYIDEALHNPEAAELKIFLNRVMPETRSIAV
ncbi:MAG: aminoglycoside/choline kinase family phosphotransferase [Alphaproteobacteria bacterium]|jgi:aminoglycoside/choline kinase family phosphotransferase